MSKSPGEFELIARLTERLRHGPRTLLGPGDDCAILTRPRTAQLFTIDSLVEGVHFRLNWGPAEALGARALTVNLSDIAAMGGVPTACVVNLAIRPRLSAHFFDRLYAGLRGAAEARGVDVVGGNVTSAGALAITIALLGNAGSSVMRRDAARPADEIFVTGTVGDAALGWRILAGKLRARGESRKYLVDRFLNPAARLTAGQRLARIKPPPAAIDISDGLWQDLGHLLERSGVGAEVEAAAIPLSPAYRAVAGDNLQLALRGGEDYELLFCARPGQAEDTLTRRLGVPVRRIGKIIRGRGARLVGDDAIPTKIPARVGGWDQLRAPNE
ncbi:MAG TPA: thiamine-phosphate kinase [Candidatus Binataceae bacterium]|nr:thiamine-phosphate kinase [Candidatus Binataceae bacterium]